MLNIHDKDFNIHADCMFCYRSFRVCEIFISLLHISVEAVSMSDSFTSRALPTWQVFVRDQLEASNTITLPPPRDTQSWPEKHTYALYQLFPKALSNTQVPVFTLLRQEKCLYQPTYLVGKIFEFGAILQLHNGQFLPWLLHNHTVGST